MTKHRGLRRYYKRLNYVNDFQKRITWLNFKDPDIWFDYWRVFYDNKGFGNKSFKRRKPHLDMLFRHYEIAAREMLQTNTRFQLWIFINDFRSIDDCLFFHTPNPNGTHFPHKYPALSTACNFRNQELISYLQDRHDFQKWFGEYHTDDLPVERCCVLYKEHIWESIV